jgi:hypothetical protein
MIEKRLRAVASPGTVIPKPRAKRGFRVKGDGTRRSRPALIYTIPNIPIRRGPTRKASRTRSWSERMRICNEPAR